MSKLSFYVMIYLIEIFFIVGTLFAQNIDSVGININNFDFAINNKGEIGNIGISTRQVPQFEEGDIFYLMGFAVSGLYNTEVWSNGIFISNNTNNDYLPGKVNSDPEEPRNKIYIVKRSESAFSNSWDEWKDAVELGANFYDGNNDSVYDPIDLNNNGKWDENEDMPDLLGDLTAWCIYNDGLPALDREFVGQTPKGIEVKQTVFLSSLPNADNLGNVFFVRYEIENTGTVSEIFDSVYFSFIIDADVGDYHNDLASCDTNLQLGITYNSIENEDTTLTYGIFKEKPPALLLYPLQQPHVFIQNETYIDNNNNFAFDFGIDTPLDSSVINRGPLLRQKIIQGSKLMDWNAFTPYYRWNSGLTNPHNENELRNLMLGGRYNSGEKFTAANFTNNFDATFNDSLVDPLSINPKFVASGNPLTNVGWLFTEEKDFRMLISYGPFTFRKGDPQEVMCAIIAGRGEDRLSSITEAKRIASAVKEIYDNNFRDLPVGIEKNIIEIIPTRYLLEQNYPNPFNPSTRIKYSIPSSVISNEQSDVRNLNDSKISPSGRNDNMNVTLKVYDVLGREVATLVNQKQKPGNYEVNFNASNLSSGVYFYRLQSGNVVQTKKMILMR